MSNSDPSVIVRQGIPCMRGLYKFQFEWRNGSLKVCRDSLSRSRMRSRTGLASPAGNQACGMAKYPKLRVHRHEERMTPAKTAQHLPERANWFEGQLATNAKC